MIIYGVRRRVRALATLRFRCSRCGQEAAQRLVRSQRWFTLFFVPLFPFGSRYVATCTYCGFAQRLDAKHAKALAAGPPEPQGQESGPAGRSPQVAQPHPPAPPTPADPAGWEQPRSV